MSSLPDANPESRQDAWEQSYAAGDNFVFFPHEEVIRFAAKYLRKRTGLDTYADRHSLGRPPRVLDLGCGLGRHVKFCHEAGMEAYGIDLSTTAIELARQWAVRYGLPEPEQRLRQGDARHLPWPDGFFDAAVSHGTLDSMPFKLARTVMADMRRVLSPQALFYLDLVSGDDYQHAREFAGDEVVETAHERGTIQSYYNYPRIAELTEGLFSCVDCVLIRREDVGRGPFISRYHLVLATS
ncbi:MAG: class I SAM-dependent methyltransferase [Lentisphaeria bacterium]|jgi:SAM-dependent methyltransferase|nr:class I SAM-dependent methyltransferase [Lentisphaeria bacterium]